MNLTAKHISTVFSQNIYFHRLNLFILDSPKKTRQDEQFFPNADSQEAQNRKFVFFGVAWFLEREFVPPNLEELITISFENAYLNSYMGSLRGSGINAMSISVDYSSSSSSSSPPQLTPWDESNTTEQEQNKPNVAVILTIFACVFCAVVVVSYMLHQREYGIDHGYVDDEMSDEMLDFEIRVVNPKPKPNRSSKPPLDRKRRNSKRNDGRSKDIFRIQGTLEKNNTATVDDLLNCHSFNSGISSLDVSVLSAETYDRRHLYEIS